ncbi:hypothetical protein BG011_004206 [Mortierella polycephala]|uniref:Cytochrome b5 heme-binding domain-containing protein n=1 Tax=Mortierella polycephala TaxID=41804 RepID=A0A9P6Q2E6_9FUNG|nr:hypothetical protein BG011_004206 [Mortierella polycephala]
MSSLYTYFENLFKEVYTLPSIIVTVSIAVFIAYLQELKDEREREQKKKEDNASNEHDDKESEESEKQEGSEDPAPKRKAFALPSTPLPPPNTTRIFMSDELAEHDGTQEDKGIYVAIKGIVFDVSTKKEMYGPKGGYHCFAGKDASKALGMSSLNVEDCVADYSGLNEKEKKTLDDWFSFFEKRYPIVGKTEA